MTILGCRNWPPSLVRRQVAVIAAPGSAAAAVAAKAATMSIPVVFGTGLDPVQLGLVASLSRPGGNVTGVSTMSIELATKRLGLLLELVPGAIRIAVLVNLNDPSEAFIPQVREAATASGRQIEVFSASTSLDIDTALASVVQKRADALLLGTGAPFAQIAYTWRRFPHATRYRRSIPIASMPKPAD